MLQLQTDVLGGNKWNCLKATQVLGGSTQILIWGSEIAKGQFILPDKLRGDLELWYQGGGGGAMNPNDGMVRLTAKAT